MQADGGTNTPYGTALRGLRRSLLLAGLASAAVSLLMLAGPVYVLQIYDRVLPAGSARLLYGMFAVMVLLYGLLAVCDALRARLLARAAARFDAALGGVAFLRLLEAPAAGAGAGPGAEAPAAAGAGAAPEAGADPGAALRDLAVLRAFLAGPAMRALFDLPWIPLFLAALVLLHPWLGLLAAAGAGAAAGLAGLAWRATRAPAAGALAGEAAAQAFLSHSLRQADSLRALGMRGAAAARWRALQDAWLTQAQRAGRRSGLYAAGARAFRLLLQAALLTAAADLALRGQISAGMIAGAAILAGRALAPVDQGAAQWREIARAAAAHGRLRAELATAPAAPEPAAAQGTYNKETAGKAAAGTAAAEPARPVPAGALAAEGLLKLAPGPGPGPGGAGARPLLQGISFALAPGEQLGVIGNSGAGKSSLARVLAGAWAPDAGRLALDGTALGHWPPDALGRAVGYLPQHAGLLPGTIAENIARFAPAADQDEVIRAARAAGVHGLIEALPGGYGAAACGPEPGGPALPGGALQRLALARAFYGRPRFVVLDEPAAHLDARGEEALMAALAALKTAGCTVVLTAHRPSLLAFADKILVLHEGRMARFGPRAEILSPARPRRRGAAGGDAAGGGAGPPPGQAGRGKTP